MSERAFFTKRYTLPGLTFLAVIIAINLRELYHLIFFKSDIFFRIDAISSIIVTLLTILGGERIGFLFAQMWHALFAWWDEKRLYYHPLSQLLNEKYSIKDKEMSLKILYDHITTDIPENIEAYFNRRYDMICILGTSLFCIEFGYMWGLWLKYQLHKKYNLFLFKISDDGLFIFLSLILLLTFYIISKNVRRIMDERYDMALVYEKSKKLKTIDDT